MILAIYFGDWSSHRLSYAQYLTVWCLTLVQELTLLKLSLKLIVLKHFPLLALPLMLGAGFWARPAIAQALIPHVPQLDYARMEQQGLSLAQEAAQLAQFQQYELALVRAQLATQLVPQNGQVWALLGSLYLQVGQGEKAIAPLLKAESLSREDPAILFALGTAYFRAQNYARSVEYLRKGLALKADEPGAWFDLGNAYYMQKRYADAIESYEKSVELQEDFWPSINNIGLVLYEMGDIDGALEKWREAIAIDGNQAEPQLAVAVALFVQGKQEEALKMGEAALNLDDRYAEIDFLRENLWGDRLIEQTRLFLQLPRMRETLAQIRQAGS